MELKERIMILAAVATIFTQLFVAYYLNFESKRARCRSYILKGGLAKAKLKSYTDSGNKKICCYSYSFDHKDYEISFIFKEIKETIDVYFDPKYPDKALTLDNQNKTIKYLTPLFMVMPLILLMIFYKIIN